MGHCLREQQGVQGWCELGSGDASGHRYLQPLVQSIRQCAGYRRRRQRRWRRVDCSTRVDVRRAHRVELRELVQRRAIARLRIHSQRQSVRLRETQVGLKAHRARSRNRRLSRSTDRCGDERVGERIRDASRHRREGGALASDGA